MSCKIAEGQEASTKIGIISSSWIIWPRYITCLSSSTMHVYTPYNSLSSSVSLFIGSHSSQMSCRENIATKAVAL